MGEPGGVFKPGIAAQYLQGGHPVMSSQLTTPDTMTARDREAALLARCAAVASGLSQRALDQREANVFMLAAMTVRHRFPAEAEHLMQSAERYFAAHPDERLDPADIVRRGWVTSMQRLSDRLDRHFLSAR